MNNISWFNIYEDELCLKASRIDIEFWSSMVREYDTEDVFSKRSYKVMGCDIFNMLQQAHPELSDSPPEPSLGAWIHQALNREDIAELRDRTVGNREQAFASAVELFRKFLERKETLLNQISQMRSAKDVAEVLNPSQVQAIENMLKALVQAAERGFGEVEQEVLGESVQEAMDAIDALSMLSSLSYGLGGGMDARQLDLFADKQLLEKFKNSSEFKQVLASLGRVQVLRGKVKSRKPIRLPRPVGIEQGRELSRLLPSELGKLGDPDLDVLFDLKMLEGSLAQYKIETKEVIGKGPIIMCLDMSGSMRGEPLNLARGLFLELTRAAIEQHRDIGFVPFASYALDVRVMKKLEDIAWVVGGDHDVGWGTDFSEPFRKVLEYKGEDMRECDVLFLSDGISRLSPYVSKEVLKWKNETGTRIMGAMIGRYGWADDMRAVLDQSIEVKDTGDISWMEGMFEEIER